MDNKTILIITDGIGYNNSNEFNAFKNANTPTYDYLFKNVPNSLIHTHGEHVGLPDGQMGNSEVGHMTIGSGRTLYQDLVKINLSIKDDTLKDNKILTDTIDKSNDIHLVGLVSNGGVHSHINHIIALGKIAQSFGKKVFFHVITDGRDVAPNSALKYIEQLNSVCNDNIKIATVSGRYYTMDRDQRWERVQKGYDAIAFGLPKTKENITEYIQKSYEKDVYDEFIEPCAFHNYNGVKKSDGIIFCNFRSDRMREITSAFANSDFNEFSRFSEKLNIATMTEYDKNLPLQVLFPKDNPKNTLAEVISKANLTQLHTSETEKYAHVTFFFNGGVEEPVANEKRVLIPSPKVATYDLQPQMSAPEVSQTVQKAMDEENDFIVVNFANGDMVGHTGNYDAALKAVEAVDKELDKIFQKAKDKNYNIVLTSDHGNCEMMKDKDGNTLTNHTVGDVYCFVYSKKVKKIQAGSLSNIAPTVLKLMNLEIPKEMDKALF
ncbi:MAG: 2,3-bisphosphoglycerate-independent phosphoglycerate mutase [Campylobacterota bacterium]